MDGRMDGWTDGWMGVLGTTEWVQGETETAVGNRRSDRGQIKRIWVTAEKSTSKHAGKTPKMYVQTVSAYAVFHN